ncbi:MAG: hypothetical protein IJ588_05180 [Prevotella sp.]|nr:hypothetical protein [Prevotella sp.]
MQQNEELRKVVGLLEQCKLGPAINALENVLLINPGMGNMDALLAIKNDYSLMLQYWERGFEDAQREQLYGQLLARLYVLTANIITQRKMHQEPFWIGIYQRPRQVRKDWSMNNVRSQLENFTSEVALLELESPQQREEKAKTLYEEHQMLMQDLFGYILTSRLWTENLAKAFEDLLLSPTVDPVDQQLIVSAVTLSAMQMFGINKFQLLLKVYRQATVEQVRQRALVGWVLAIDERKTRLYPALQQMVSEVLADKRCCQEVTELQMQMVYCMNAEDDQQTIRDEILPEIMNGNNIRLTQRGLVEMDEDSLEDILHPDAAERNMEKMEQSMHRMADMQKQGADIYFGGFSQMKRFTFFNDLSNWFVPFYPQHPSISHIWNNTKNKRFLQIITQVGAFCDSDKYSFVLAFEYVLGRLPASMLQMIENGEASPMPVGGEISEEEQSQPAFMRRMYLQNLYRFFRLYGSRNEFPSPFAMPQAIFFGKAIFSRSGLQGSLLEMGNFLYKRKYYDAAKGVIANLDEERRNFNYYVLQGMLQQRKPDFTSMSALESFARAIKVQPDSEQALAGYARAAFNAQGYEAALEKYEQLLEIKPDSKNYQLNAAICLSNLERNEEAEMRLFKLNYLYPDDRSVNHVLAWVLTLNGKYEQADKLYNDLLSVEKPKSLDILNYGYCHWVAGETMVAIAAFRQFMNTPGCEDYDMEKEFYDTSHKMLSERGISDVEISMMLDSLR